MTAAQDTRWHDDLGVTELACTLMRVLRLPHGSAVVRALCKAIVEQCDIADADYDDRKADAIAQAALVAAHGRITEGA